MIEQIKHALAEHGELTDQSKAALGFYPRLKEMLQLPALQTLTCVRQAQKETNAHSIIEWLKVDADKIRTHSPELYQLLFAGRHMFFHDNDAHEIAFIEYRGNRLFDVHTLSDPLHRQDCYNTWDFEYSKSCSSLMYHNSGRGLSYVCLSRFVKVNPKRLVKFYLKENLPLYGYIGTRIIKLTRPEQWEKMGYKRIYEPLMIGNSRNPFDNAVEGETVYCRTCKDWFPRDEYHNFCKHLAWCDTCADVVHINLKTGKHSIGWDEDRHEHTHSLSARD